jgi:hypothetical protein
MTLTDEFLAFLGSIKGKRARVVIDHILKHGLITTEDLETIYGYKHPPRAIRDVRDQGVPVETFSVKNSQGRTIAAYRFGDYISGGNLKIGGRKLFPKAFKQQLIELSGSRCSVCLETYEQRYLQIDHRIPYAVGGDAELTPENYMLVCGSCNRAKSWSCEHCINWLERKDPNICLTCYWTNPAHYEHIALRQLRRLTLVWTEDETKTYQNLASYASEAGISLVEYVKKLLETYEP